MKREKNWGLLYIKKKADIHAWIIMDSCCKILFLTGKNMRVMNRIHTMNKHCTIISWFTFHRLQLNIQGSGCFFRTARALSKSRFSMCFSISAVSSAHIDDPISLWERQDIHELWGSIISEEITKAWHESGYFQACQVHRSLGISGTTSRYEMSISVLFAFSECFASSGIVFMYFRNFRIPVTRFWPNFPEQSEIFRVSLRHNNQSGQYACHYY